MKKRLLLLIVTFCLIFFASSIDLTAQSTDNGSRISVDAIGEVRVPADIIQFRINITRFNKDAREAFEEHKELESFLTNLLLEEDIDDESINAEPISIHPRRQAPRSPGQEEIQGFETRQQVSIELDDVTRFEAMQLTLIENNFDNFSGTFGSTQIEKAKDEAIAKAVQEARRKAEILADAAGYQVGDVISIRFASSSPEPMPAYRMEMAYDSSGGSLLQFEKTIPVREHVHVEFLLTD